MSLYLGNNQISGLQSNIEPTRNIGQVIQSTIPLTDAGLHLLDGALISGDGIYADFVDYMITLYGSHPECFATEADWQGTVNAYGACGKFVYDNVNNTIRLPKITGFIEGTIDNNALGELVEAGLPNHIHSIGQQELRCGINNDYANYNDGGSLGGWGIGTAGSNNTGQARLLINSHNTNNVSNDSIYGNSTTVQPQAIKVFYYIVIATTTKTDIEVDIDEVITDLNTKANNIDVVHLTGTETITGNKTFTGSLAIPSNTMIAKQNDDVEGGQIIFQKANNDPLSQDPVIDLYSGFIRFLYCSGVEIPRIDSPSGHLEFIKDRQSPNDNPSYPGYYLAFEDVSGWQKIMSSFNFQVVSTLPASPNGNVYYFIPE